MGEYWGEGGTIHFFLLTLYNFKNIGGHVPALPPYSAVPGLTRDQAEGLQGYSPHHTALWL